MNSERRRRALITRPQEDAAAVAVALARRGITPVLAPMMQTEFEPADIDADLARAQAVLFTSRNGVRAFSRVSDRRDIPVYAVGDSTADLARDNGFSTVESAGGDSADLARLVAGRLDPSDGPLLHIAGKTVAGDLSGALAADGFEIVRRTLYEAKPAPVLTAETAAAIRNEEIDYVLFFSPRTAQVFSDLVEAAGLTAHCRNFEAICLSEAVAAELPAADWKVRRTAASPTSDALLQTVDAASGGDTATAEDAAHTPSLIPQSPFAKDPPPPPAESGNEPVDDSGPVDLAPLQKAIERAAARADAPRPGSDDPPSADTDPVESDDAPDASSAADAIVEETEEQAAPKGAGPVDPPPLSDDDEKPTPESSMTETATPETAQSDPDEKVLSPATAPPRSRAPAVAWTLVVVFAVAIAGYFTLPMWRDKLPQYVQDRLGGGRPATVVADDRVTAELTALRTQNDTLKAAVADLGKNLEDSRARLSAIDDIAARQSTGEKALEDLRSELKTAAQPETPAVDTELLARLDALEKSISGTIAAQSGQAAAGQKLDAGMAALTARIAALEAAVAELQSASTASGKIDALALAAGRLRDALARATPFEAEIATLKNLAGDNAAVAAAIATVESRAMAGIPSRASVLSRLPGTVDAIVAATRTPDDGGWMDRTVSKLRSFVTVRRVDGKGGGADAIVARAETAANRGDLAVAVAEMSKLDGKAADVSKAWLQDARARLAAEAARTALDRIVLDGLATSG